MGNKINWKNHFIELLIVTSGILIAFGLNSWNEARKEKKLAELYLAGIYEEMENNKAELLEKFEYHQGLLASLEEDPLNTRVVLRQPRVTNGAWKLSENDVFKRYVDPVLYQKINSVYQTHESLNSLSSESSRMMTELNLLGPLYAISVTGKTFSKEEEEEITKSVKSGWIPIFQDWIYEESEYLKKLEDALGYKP